MCLLIACLSLLGCAFRSAPMTDADYEALADAALFGEDGSPEARAAGECRSMRDAAGTAVEVGTQSAELEGMTAEQMFRYLAAEDGAGPHISWLEKCPLGGRYGVRVFVSRTLYDGTVFWGQEVSCSIHTPEAYARYEAGLE